MASWRTADWGKSDARTQVDFSGRTYARCIHCRSIETVTHFLCGLPRDVYGNNYRSSVVIECLRCGTTK